MKNIIAICLTAIFLSACSGSSFTSSKKAVGNIVETNPGGESPGDVTPPGDDDVILKPGDPENPEAPVIPDEPEIPFVPGTPVLPTNPTVVPTVIPTAVPTVIPTAVPTMIPTVVPTVIPTAVPPAPVVVQSVSSTVCSSTSFTGGARFSCAVNQVAKAFGYSGGYKVQCCSVYATMSDGTQRQFKTAVNGTAFVANNVGNQTACPAGYLLSAGSSSGATCVKLMLEGTNIGLQRGTIADVDTYTISATDTSVKTCKPGKLAYAFGDNHGGVGGGGDRDPDTLYCNSISATK